MGAGLVAKLEQEARRQGMARLVLHAQTWTIPFYQSINFSLVDGEDFLEAGIPHRVMEKDILGTSNGRGPNEGESGL